jgi:hypothetical protein
VLSGHRLGLQRRAGESSTGSAVYEWRLIKGSRTIQCALARGGSLGWVVRLVFDYHWSVNCEFTTMLDAVDSAEIKCTELFRAGWRGLN